MPVDLSYKGMFVDVFLCGGIVFAYLALVVYRIMAASLFPRLNSKTCFRCFRDSTARHVIGYLA